MDEELLEIERTLKAEGFSLGEYRPLEFDKTLLNKYLQYKRRTLNLPPSNSKSKVFFVKDKHIYAPYDYTWYRKLASDWDERNRLQKEFIEQLELRDNFLFFDILEFEFSYAQSHGANETVFQSVDGTRYNVFPAYNNAFFASMRGGWIVGVFEFVKAGKKNGIRIVEADQIEELWEKAKKKKKRKKKKSV